MCLLSILPEGPMAVGQLVRQMRLNGSVAHGAVVVLVAVIICPTVGKDVCGKDDVLSIWRPFRISDAHGEIGESLRHPAVGGHEPRLCAIFTGRNEQERCTVRRPTRMVIRSVMMGEIPEPPAVGVHNVDVLRRLSFLKNSLCQDKRNSLPVR